MDKKLILLVVFAFILLISFPIKASEVKDLLDPVEPGLYNVGYYKVIFNDPVYGCYIATIRYPAKYDGLFAIKDRSEAPYPGIVVSNGFAGSAWNIKWISNHLSSYGYVTICFTPPNKLSSDSTQWAFGFLRGIETLKIQNSKRFSPISELLDTETFGGIGLSLGGAGCIQATGMNGSEIDASVALAPACSNASILAAKNISVPIQIQVGNNDGMVPPKRVLSYYTDIFSDNINKEYLSITGANHIGYVDELVARIAELIGLDEPKEIEFEEQHRISRSYFTAWFEYYLKGHDEYFTYIFGKNANDDLNEGILSDLRYIYS